MNRNILNDLLSTRDHLNEEELNAYLSDSAPSEVRHKVENSMLGNPLYGDAVEGYQEMGLSAIPNLESFSDFKKKLPATDGAKVVELTIVQRLLRVAAVAVVLLLGTVAYNAFQSSSPDTLYSNFYTPYDNDISLTRRGDADGLNKDFKKALGLYAVGHFDAALSGFNKALEAEPKNDAAHFFAGLACMELSQYENSIQHLNIVSNNNGTYARKADWYAVLATLKSGGTEATKSRLQEFLEIPGFKNAEARKLMKKLSSD